MRVRFKFINTFLVLLFCISPALHAWRCCGSGKDKTTVAPESDSEGSDTPAQEENDAPTRTPARTTTTSSVAAGSVGVSQRSRRGRRSRSTRLAEARPSSSSSSSSSSDNLVVNRGGDSGCPEASGTGSSWTYTYITEEEGMPVQPAQEGNESSAQEKNDASAGVPTRTTTTTSTLATGAGRVSQCSRRGRRSRSTRLAEARPSSSSSSSSSSDNLVVKRRSDSGRAEASGAGSSCSYTNFTEEGVVPPNKANESYSSADYSSYDAGAGVGMPDYSYVSKSDSEGSDTSNQGGNDAPTRTHTRTTTARSILATGGSVREGERSRRGRRSRSPQLAETNSSSSSTTSSRSSSLESEDPSGSASKSIIEVLESITFKTIHQSYKQVKAILSRRHTMEELNQGNPLGYIVSKLISAKPDEDACQFNSKLLEFFHLLLNAGAVRNECDRNGNTPLNGLIKKLKLCSVKLKERLNQRLGIRTSKVRGEKPQLHLNTACHIKMNDEILRHIQLLLLHGADPNNDSNVVSMLPVALLVESLRMSMNQELSDEVRLNVLKLMRKSGNDAALLFQSLFPTMYAALKTLIESGKLNQASCAYLNNSQGRNDEISKFIARVFEGEVWEERRVSDSVTLTMKSRQGEGISFKNGVEYRECALIGIHKKHAERRRPPLSSILSDVSAENVNMWVPSEGRLRADTPLSLAVADFTRDSAFDQELDDPQEMIIQLLEMGADPNVMYCEQYVLPLSRAFTKLSFVCRQIIHSGRECDVYLYVTYLEKLVAVICALLESGANQDYIFEDDPYIMAVLKLVLDQDIPRRFDRKLQLAEICFKLLEVDGDQDLIMEDTAETVFHWFVRLVHAIKRCSVHSGLCTSVETLPPILTRICELLVSKAHHQKVDIHSLKNEGGKTVKKLAEEMKVLFLLELFGPPRKVGWFSSCFGAKS